MRLILLVLIIIAFGSCKTAKNNQSVSPSKAYLEADDQDSSSYELIVLDPSYETYLVSQAHPIDFYSNDYYRSWNMRYVGEWNIRHNNPIRYGSFYETPINYDGNEDYDKELNFRLYHYFIFIEQRYGIILINRGRTSP